MTGIKICGLTEEPALKAAAAEGADYIGFVFYPPSSRHVSVERAGALMQAAPAGIKTVGLFVNPQDRDIERVLDTINLDYIQLHGSESPERVLKIKEKSGAKIIKAVSIGSKDDLKQSLPYESIVDILMFDTKTADDALPGGTGQAFDWSILAGHTPKKPWMLAGGLTAENVTQALCLLHPVAVDVSSGVENAPGKKDPVKIAEFIRAVKDHDKSQ